MFPKTRMNQPGRSPTPNTEGHSSVSNDYNGEYTEEELVFLKAVEAWKKKHKVKFPTWIDILDIAKALGYSKPPDATGV